MTETWTFGWFLNLYILEIVTDPNPPPPFPRFDKYWSNNGWDPAWVSLRGTLWWPWRLMGLLFFCLVYAVLIMADLIGCPGSVINSIILQLSIPWSDRVWENRLCWRSVALDWFHIKFSAELAPQKLLFRKGSNEMVNKSLSLNKLANQKTSARRKSCFLGTLLKVNCTCTSTYHY